MRKAAPLLAVLAALLGGLAAGRLAAVPPPAVEAVRDGLALTHLPPILGDEEVRKQLATGLTTSFVFTAEARGASGAKLTGAARVDVRYDLWDEVYLVTRIDASGHAARVTLPSFERLAEWWREERLVVLRGPAVAGARRRQRAAAADPLLAGRAARHPALVLPGALGRESRGAPARSPTPSRISRNRSAR